MKAILLLFLAMLLLVPLLFILANDTSYKMPIAAENAAIMKAAEKAAIMKAAKEAAIIWKETLTAAKNEKKRYTPNLNFNLDPTPLTLIDILSKENLDGKSFPLPEGWDGGYGWAFVKYHPSKFESEWAEMAAKIEHNPGSPLCDLLMTTFKKEYDIYKSFLGQMVPDDSSQRRCAKRNVLPTEPVELPSEVFSRYEYEFKCTVPRCNTTAPASGPKVGDKKFTCIEPLVGLLRHPLICESDTFLTNKSYMLVDAWSLSQTSRTTISPDPKIMYFDAGASIWDSGFGGASQSWFHGVFENLCLPFSDMFMWEAINHDPKNVFNLLPGRLKSSYRWFNIFLQTQIESWDNPLNHLLKEAHKEDIVIFKIDFDSVDVEEELISQILKYHEVSDLISPTNPPPFPKLRDNIA